LGQKRERSRGHGGTEIRAADVDVDDIGKACPARGPDFAVVDRFGECPHLRPFRQNLRHDIVALCEHWPARKIAQGHVQGWSVLGGIDGLAREGRRPARLDTGRAREIDEQPERRFVEPVFE
jgi:hypothetical protein